MADKKSGSEVEEPRLRTPEELAAIRARPYTEEELEFIREWGLDKTPEERAAEQIDWDAHNRHLNELAEEVERRAASVGHGDDEDLKSTMFAMMVRGTLK